MDTFLLVTLSMVLMMSDLDASELRSLGMFEIFREATYKIQPREKVSTTSSPSSL